MNEYNMSYDLNTSILKNDKYASELSPLYKILNPTIKQEYAEYFQRNLNETESYLEFLVTNGLPIDSVEVFNQRLDKIKGHPQYYKNKKCILMFIN